MNLIFDKQQWVFRTAEAEVVIAGLSGDVLVSSGAKESIYHTVPPSGFYTFARDILKAKDLRDWQFYMDAMKGKRGMVYVFGVENTVKEHDYDLWKYTPSTLPLWYKHGKGKKA